MEARVNAFSHYFVACRSTSGTFRRKACQHTLILPTCQTWLSAVWFACCLLGSFHAAIAALLLSAHLADTGMCIVFLSLAFAVLFVPGQGRFRVLRPWKLVLLLLGVLAVAHKAIDLWFKLPHMQTVAPMWSRTCLHQWLGVVPLTSFEERQLQLTSVLSMLMISAHVRAILKESRPSRSAAGLLADFPREALQRSSLASSPLLDEHEANADGDARGESQHAETAGLPPPASASDSTLSADHWRETRRSGAGLQGSGNTRIVTFEDGDDASSSGRREAASDDAWMGWTLAQATIGCALLVLFYLFAAVKNEDEEGSGGGSQQALAPLFMALLILHALVARSCIRSVCQRLQVTVYPFAVVRVLRRIVRCASATIWCVDDGVSRREVRPPTCANADARNRKHTRCF